MLLVAELAQVALVCDTLHMRLSSAEALQDIVKPLLVLHRAIQSETPALEYDLVQPVVYQLIESLRLLLNPHLDEPGLLVEPREQVVHLSHRTGLELRDLRVSAIADARRLRADKTGPPDLKGLQTDTRSHTPPATATAAHGSQSLRWPSSNTLVGSSANDSPGCASAPRDLALLRNLDVKRVWPRSHTCMTMIATDVP